jgi:hypothetical protein
MGTRSLEASLTFARATGHDVLVASASSLAEALVARRDANQA